jgi:monoamine oxidase
LFTDSVLERIFPLRDEGGAVVALGSHADGPAAVQLDAMEEEARLRHAEDTFVRMRPAAEGAIEAVASTSWANEPFSGGAYPFYAPGQVGRLRPEVARPLGRLHFAGEHTALASPGMEGACESADRAVAELLARA